MSSVNNSYGPGPIFNQPPDPTNGGARSEYDFNRPRKNKTISDPLGDNTVSFSGDGTTVEFYDGAGNSTAKVANLTNGNVRFIGNDGNDTASFDSTNSSNSTFLFRPSSNQNGTDYDVLNLTGNWKIEQDQRGNPLIDDKDFEVTFVDDKGNRVRTYINEIEQININGKTRNLDAIKRGRLDK